MYLIGSEHGCSTAEWGEDGTTLVHASEASASVLALAQLWSGSEMKGVEMDEKKFMRAFHF
jgi:hypothetical protein